MNRIRRSAVIWVFSVTAAAIVCIIWSAISTCWPIGLGLGLLVGAFVLLRS